MKFHFIPEEAAEELKKGGEDPFVVLLQRGTLQIEYFAPVGKDNQTPHRQDELYVIASGEGWLDRDGTILKCKQGDVLFVPAGMKHQFKNFTVDFATWVIFYGKDGGEANA